MDNLENYEIEVTTENGEDTIALKELAAAVKQICQYTAESVENIEIATVIITWLQKMINKVYNNVVALEKLKKEEKDG